MKKCKGLPLALPISKKMEDSLSVNLRSHVSALMSNLLKDKRLRKETEAGMF